VEEAQFEHVGVFRYSQEEGTPAAILKGQVSERIKDQRYHQIMARQKKISYRKQKKRVGSRIEVLVERPGTSPGILGVGRTQGQAPDVDGVVFLTKGKAQPGEIYQAFIARASAYDLYGEIPGPA